MIFQKYLLYSAETAYSIDIHSIFIARFFTVQNCSKTNLVLRDSIIGLSKTKIKYLKNKKIQYFQSISL